MLLVHSAHSGIAMGTIAAPSIANIFLYCIEKEFIYIHRPLCYYRFIDDIFIATRKNFDINILKSSFDINLNINSDKIVQFLDLNIYFCKYTKRLKFSLYIKPTNTFSYLFTDSNHPNYITNNIPKSLFIRIRRICSNFYDYV